MSEVSDLLKGILVKHAKAALHEVNDVVIPAGLDLVKASIPGVIDDLVIETLKPELKKQVAALIDGIGA